MVNHGYDNGSSSSSVLAALARAHLFAAPRRLTAESIAETADLSIFARNGDLHSMDMVMANFGVQRYDVGEMSLKLVKPDMNSDGCRDFKEAGAPTSSDHWGIPAIGTGSPVALALDFPTTAAGNCTYIQRAFNAQNAGAAAVILIDNVPERRIPTIGSDPAAIEMASKITIPVFVLTSPDGAFLRSMHDLAAFQMVSAKISWVDAIPRPDDQVDLELWTSALNGDACGSGTRGSCRQEQEFIVDFAPTAVEMIQKGYINIKPNFPIWSCFEGWANTTACNSQCLNHGRYCNPDPDRVLDAGYEGKDVAIQNLRSVCVHRLAELAGKPELWWLYTVPFIKSCTMESKSYTAQCAEGIFNALDIANGNVLGGVSNLNACMGNTEIDAENQVLQEQMVAQDGHDGSGYITIVPALVINNSQYRGAFYRDPITKAICAGFLKGTEPEMCNVASANVCSRGRAGDVACSDDEHQRRGNTVCSPFETGYGFQCLCGPGRVYTFSYDIDGYTCMPINYCKTEANGLDECTCDRCVCYNQPPRDPTGTTAPNSASDDNDVKFLCDKLDLPCDDEGAIQKDSHMPFWSQMVDGVEYSACYDNIKEVRELSARGMINTRTEALVHIATFQCPEGFAETQEPSGKKACTRISMCDTHCLGHDMKCFEALPGAYNCHCNHGGIYVESSGECIANEAASSLPIMIGILVVSLVAVVCAMWAAWIKVIRPRLDKHENRYNEQQNVIKALTQRLIPRAADEDYENLDDAAPDLPRSTGASAPPIHDDSANNSNSGSPPRTPGGTLMNILNGLKKKVSSPPDLEMHGNEIFDAEGTA